jgi:hypothetical protein
MVDFEFKPIQKIIIHEILKWSMEEFIDRFVKPNSIVQWVDGIVMQRSAYASQTPKMIDDEVNGIVHWAMVEFAKMPDYRPKLMNETIGAFAQVNDVSNNNVFKDFARWLKNDQRWFPNTSE